MSFLSELRHSYFLFKCNLDAIRRLILREILLYKSRSSLVKIRDSWKGRSVFIVGNGPSLTADQISLASHSRFIATNRAYQLFSADSFRSGGNGFLIINDHSRVLEVLPTLPDSFQQVVFGCPDPLHIYSCARIASSVFVFAKCIWRIRFNHEGIKLDDNEKLQFFSSNFLSGYFPGHSVAFAAIQLAAFLGAKRIYLIGCDMDYSGPKEYSSLIKPERHGIGHLGFFDYSLHGRPHMLACIKGLKKMGIEMFNATPQGAIHEVPRVSIDKLKEMLEQDRNGS